MRAMQKRLVLFGQSLWQNREDALLALIAFFAPAHFFLKGDVAWAVINGLPVDYLFPKLYAADVLILLLLLSAKLPHLDTNERKTLLVWLAFCMIHLLLQAGSPLVLSSAWFLAELTLGLGLLRYLLHRPGWWRGPLFFWGVLAGVLWQTGLGLGQLALNREVAGYLLLGEPTLSVSRSDVAVSDIPLLGERILPYGTTAHPHLLAVFLTSGLIFLWVKRRPQATGFFFAGIQAVLLISILVVIARTESLTATVAAGALMMLFFGWKKTLRPVRRFAVAMSVLAILIVFGVPVLLASVRNLEPSWSRRAALQAIAVKAFLEHPIAGVGSNQLAAESESYGFAPATYRFRQPPHHAGLLWLAETGVIGILTLFIILVIAHKKYALKKDRVALVIIPFAILFSLDHFLLSNRFGQLFCIACISLVLEKRTQMQQRGRVFEPKIHRKKKTGR